MTTRWPTLGLSLLILTCQPPASEVTTWLSRQDSTGFFQLDQTENNCNECVRMERLVLFGDEAGPNFVEWPRSAVKDAQGRFWLNQWDEVKVFSPTGEFVGAVGRKGQGPLEWSYPFPVHVDSLGNTHIFDLGNVRESIVSPDFRLLGERRIPGGEIWAVLPLIEDGRFVVNMFRQTPGPPWLPLHIIEGDSVLRSFGERYMDFRRGHHQSRREVAVGPEGRIFSAKENHYEVEVWTGTGDRIGGLRGPTLNEQEVKPTAYTFDDNPLPTKIIGLLPLDSLKLAVVVRRPRENWRDFYERRVLPNGQVGIQLREGSTHDSVFVVRIDIIDLPSRSIIGSRERDGSFTGLIWPGLLLEVSTTERGVPRLGFWRIEFKAEPG